MGNIGQTALKALSEEGIEAVHVDFPQNLFRDEPGYRRELLKAVERWEPEAVMPVGHPLALSRMRDELSRLGVRALVEEEALIRILDSKVAFSRLAAGLGLCQPRVYDSPEEVSFPARIVFKRDVSFGGHGVHLPVSKEGLDNLIAHQSPGEAYLIEDYIEGEDYSVDAARFGDAFHYGVYKTISSKGNGPAMIRQRVEMPELGSIARRILNHLNYNGVCGFDFKIDSCGRAYILEANPRLTGGLETQLDAGFNIPAIIVTSQLKHIDIW